MHAMLALSASHLEKLAPSSLTVTAQNHRLAAIKGLNEALSQPLSSTEEGDAAIAVCYALLMQSWYMDDGLQASLVLTRSCGYTTKWVREQKFKSILSEDDEEARLATMKGRFKDAPRFDTKFIERGLGSLQGLEALCEEEVHFKVFDGLREAYQSLTMSSVACKSYVFDPPLFFG
jgi:hypothetical protein